ncbi:MAG: type II toxin-antitoxin system VapC family toxin [Pseudomonadota bacterium]
MRFLLDTNVCISYLNGRSEAIKRELLVRRREDIVMCSVVKAELCYGAFKSKNPQRNLETLWSFVEGFASLPLDDNAAGVYGRIRADLERIGRPIGPNDFLIAAIAIANDVTLVTHNIREFGRINGLTVEDWETEDPCPL